MLFQKMKTYICKYKKNILFVIALICAFTVEATPVNSFGIDRLDSWCIYCRQQNEKFKYLNVVNLSQSVELNGRVYAKFEAFGLDTYLYFRQDGGKIYCYFPESQQEKLVIDFDLNVGDKFTMQDGTEMQVEEVGDTCVFTYFGSGGKKNKMLKFRSVSNPTQKDVWVDGIGSLRTGFLDLSGIDSIEESFVCHMVANNDLYYLPIVEKDYLKTTWFVSDESLPYEHKDSLSYEFVNDTLHVTGCLNLWGHYHYVFCNILEGNRIHVVCHDLPDIFDTYRLEPNTIDIKVPGFKPGIYSIAGTDIQLECKNASSPYDLDGDGVLTLNDITVLINMYLEREP